MSGKSRINLYVCAVLMAISTTTLAQTPTGNLRHAYTMEWYLARGAKPKALAPHQWNHQVQQYSRMVRNFKTSDTDMVSIDASDEVQRLASARHVRRGSASSQNNHRTETWSILGGFILAWEGKLRKLESATPETINVISAPAHIQHTLAAYRRMTNSARRSILEADAATAGEIVNKFRAEFPVLVTTDWFEYSGQKPDGQTKDEWSEILADFTKRKQSVVRAFEVQEQQLAARRERQVAAAESALRLAEQTWHDGSASQDEALIKRMSWLLHAVDLELTKLQLRDMKDQAANGQTHQRYTSKQRQMAFDFFVQLSADVCDRNAVARNN